MPATDLLRPSRDGDQFHYYWAARRSLQLLLPDTALTELVVESSGDASPDDASEQVIDLTEHWEAGHSPQVVYRQLKHSTLRADVPWTASFLKRTVIGFSQRYARLRADRSPLASACEFVFLTNRPAAPAVTDALDGLRAGQVPNDAASLLRGAVAEELDDEAAADFFSRLRLDTEGPGLLRLTHLFRTDIATVLPGTSGSEDVLLKEMIARRATSLQGRDPRVTKETVLAELGTSADQLLPAPSDLDPPRGLIETEQIGELVGTVASAQGTPVLIHAAGGVGKTVLAQSLNQHLPAGSISLVYDCFAKGGYRRSSTPRHQHAQAYVQISNELAARGLCRPLVPSPTATAQDYSRALMDRLSTASAALAATHPGGLLTIVVDAADNAVMVADERAERAFVPDLIREVSPPNVRFVFLCRTERRHLLNPPPQCRQARLLGFGAAETATHLAQRWQGVGANDAAEFHRRTAGNPRVQALVIATAPTLDDALRSLGEPKVADQAVFDHLLERRVAAAKDAHGDPAQIDGLCRALATLRPRIPIRVLAALAACEPDLIHSFASDLGRPLLIDGDAVQFRDEPSETWFRSQHRPAGADLSAFIGVLAPLAEADAYAATALPQLLYEARRTEDLVSLALSSRALPAGSDLERHEIARQRAHFALKAALREGRDLDAARLAVRAGHLAAGQGRRVKLIVENPDLAARFLDQQVVEDLVATRALAGSWPGSHLHHDGALLSTAAGQSDNARSRLRSATEWMVAHVRRAHELSNQHDVDDSDITALAWGLLNTNGPDASAEFLARWTPPDVARVCGEAVATRLVDAGRTEELEALALSPKATKHLQLAVAAAAHDGNVLLGKRSSAALAAMLVRHRKIIAVDDRHPNPLLRPVLWTVAMGLRHQVMKRQQALRILGLYLPDGLGHAAGASHNRSTETLLLAFAVRALLRNEPLNTEDLATPQLSEELGRAHSTSGEASDFRANVIPMGRVATMWAQRVTGVPGGGSAPAALAGALAGSGGYPKPQLLNNSALRVAARLVALRTDDGLTGWLDGWLTANNRTLWRSTLTDLVRMTAAHPDAHRVAIRAADEVRRELAGAKEDADTRCDDLVRLARASLGVSPEEARSHFDQALEIADRVGDDVHTRWRTLLGAARLAAQAGPSAARCYRLAQIAEALEPYLYDAFDPLDVMKTLVAVHDQHAYAIASRWRDRRVADLSRTIGAFIGPRTAAGTDPVTALALLPFGRRWDVADLTVAALEHSPSRARRTVAVIGGLTRDQPLAADAYERLRAAASARSVDLAVSGFAADPAPSPAQRGAALTPPAVRANAPRKPRVLDLTSPEGWAVALAETRSRHSPVTAADIAEHVRQAPLTQLEPITKALAKCPAADLRHVDQHIRTLAEITPRPAALAHLCHGLAVAVLHRHARDQITKGYEPLDPDAVASVTGRPVREYRRAAFDAFAGSAEQLDAEGCFHVAAKLLAQITPTDAGVVADDICTLFDEVAPVDSADGPFSALPPIEGTPSELLAGLIWAALGDPLAATRWQAAHAVRLLAELDCAAELAAVVAYAAQERAVAPFVDGRVVFYEWHARQWLLFALERAAAGHAAVETLRVAERWLLSVCYGGVPHAVMRRTAAAVLERLHDARDPAPADDERAPLARVGRPRSVEVRERDWRTRGRAPRGERATRFQFFFDFEEHWCAPLAEGFGVPPEQVLLLADRHVARTWGERFSGALEEDRRRELGLYSTDKTYVHKSSWPEEDDLDFYLAVHALQQAADDLLDSGPAIRHAAPDEDEDEDDAYEAWRRHHVPTRRDGRWLADLRDRPPKAPNGAPPNDMSSATGSDEQWIYGVRRADLEQAAFPDAGSVTVWADEEWRTYAASCSVTVRSALVPPELAPALLRAMQTGSSRDYAFPPRDPWRRHARTAPFVIDAWIDDDGGSEGLDTLDPLAKGMGWPPPRFSADHAAALRLDVDPDYRSWRSDGGELIARCRTWSTGDGRYDRGPSGRRLTVSAGFLPTALTRFQRSLVLEVEIQRRADESRRPRRDTDDRLSYLDPYFKIYVINQDGTRWEL